MTLTARASDHLDTQAVIDDPAADIGDLYVWASADRQRLNLVMTIVGKRFSDHVRYTFHVASGHVLGEPSATTTLECDFNTAVSPECRLGEIDRARGNASGERGNTSEHGRFRVFAGLRDDPFFNNVRGTRAALNVAAAAMNAGVKRDAAGCPRFDAATRARILKEWRHVDGKPGSNFLAGWNTAALVIEVDIAAVSVGGPLVGVCAARGGRGDRSNGPCAHGERAHRHLRCGRGEQCAQATIQSCARRRMADVHSGPGRDPCRV
jgi:hypothetical protein